MRPQSAAGRFREVPPPAAAPIYPGPATLGLPAFLRVERTRHSFHCAQCRRLQMPTPSGLTAVWVPDGIGLTTPLPHVAEIARLTAFNGHFSAWCVPCAHRIGASRRSATLDVAAPCGWLVPSVLAGAGMLGFIVSLLLLLLAVWLRASA